MISLPADILLAIFRYLTVHDTVNIRKTCKYLFDVCSLDSVWIQFLEVGLLRKSIPVPLLRHKPLHSLKEGQPERLVRYALSVRARWTDPFPNPVRRTELKTSSRVLALRFLRFNGGSYLLSIAVSSSGEPGHRTIECWDLSHPPQRVARRDFILQVGQGFLTINNTPESPAVLAVRGIQTEILTIDLSQPPDRAFVPLAILGHEQKGALQALSDHWVISKFHDSLHLWNFNKPLEQTQLVATGIRNESCFETCFDYQSFLVLRTQTLELFPVPTESAALTYPIAEHSFQWTIDSATIRAQAPISRNRSNIIHILLRFSSGFSWPVNLIHHFCLMPNRDYDPSSPPNMNNLPYHFPPVLVETISAPVRLFSVPDMAIGSFGTALWLDSHTEDFYGMATGQRLAGRSLVIDVDAEEIDDTGRSSLATSCYERHEQDNWTRIALDEEDAKIALASDAGNITVMEFGDQVNELA